MWESVHRSLLLQSLREWIGFYHLSKCPRRRANPWHQHLCKNPSLLPHPVSPKMKIHKMVP